MLMEGEGFGGSMSAEELLRRPESMLHRMRAAYCDMSPSPAPGPCPLLQVCCVAARHKMFLNTWLSLKEWLHALAFHCLYFFNHTGVFLCFRLASSEGLCFLFRLWLSWRSQSLLPVLVFLLSKWALLIFSAQSSPCLQSPEMMSFQWVPFKLSFITPVRFALQRICFILFVRNLQQLVFIVPGSFFYLSRQV